MKIDVDYAALDPGRMNKPKPGQSQGNAAFSDILAQAVADNAAAPQTVSAPQPAAPVAEVSWPVSETQVWEQVNGLLSVLDRYGDALGDPNQTLKDIEPLALELDAQAQELSTSLPSPGVSPLGDVGWQALSQAQAEVIKFRRGDYV